jgi:hypothetical protein
MDLETARCFLYAHIQKWWDRRVVEYLCVSPYLFLPVSFLLIDHKQMAPVAALVHIVFQYGLDIIRSIILALGARGSVVG